MDDKIYRMFQQFEGARTQEEMKKMGGKLFLSLRKEFKSGKMNMDAYERNLKKLFRIARVKGWM